MTYEYIHIMNIVWKCSEIYKRAIVTFHHVFQNFSARLSTIAANLLPTIAAVAIANLVQIQLLIYVKI